MSPNESGEASWMSVAVIGTSDSIRTGNAGSRYTWSRPRVGERDQRRDDDRARGHQAELAEEAPDDAPT